MINIENIILIAIVLISVSVYHYMNISEVYSVFDMKNNIKMVLVILWVIFGVYVLSYYIERILYYDNFYSAAEHVVERTMFYASYPIGYLVSIYVFGLHKLIEYFVEPYYLMEYKVGISIFRSMVSWILYFSVGYFQWFVLIPRVAIAIKRKFRG